MVNANVMKINWPKSAAADLTGGCDESDPVSQAQRTAAVGPPEWRADHAAGRPHCGAAAAPLGATKLICAPLGSPACQDNHSGRLHSMWRQPRLIADVEFDPIALYRYAVLAIVEVAVAVEAFERAIRGRKSHVLTDRVGIIGQPLSI